jgi:hypothetical protein
MDPEWTSVFITTPRRPTQHRSAQPTPQPTVPLSNEATLANDHGRERRGVPSILKVPPRALGVGRRPGESGRRAARNSCRAGRALPSCHSPVRDTFVTHDLSNWPETKRDDDSRNRCSTAISIHPCRSPRTDHEFMLYSDAKHFSDLGHMLFSEGDGTDRIQRISLNRSKSRSRGSRPLLAAQVSGRRLPVARHGRPADARSRPASLVAPAQS